jgi:hypothetical protein
MKTTLHTLEDKLMMEQAINRDLIEELRLLEEETMTFFPVSGEIEGVEAKDIKVIVLEDIVAAIGKTVETDELIFTVIDLKTGNMGCYPATKSGQKPCISVWQDDMEHATLFSSQLAMDFQTNRIAKDNYKLLNKQLKKYCYIYQE